MPTRLVLAFDLNAIEKALLVVYARDECILLVVEVLICEKIVFVQLLLLLCHVSVHA